LLTAAKKLKGESSKSKAKPKAPPPPPVVPSISAYRPAVSAEQEDDFMSSILGTMDALPTAPTTTKKSRKRKSSPPHEDETPSHPSAFSGRISYRQRSSSYDIDIPSSDGPWDDDGIGTGPPSSDDLVMSPAKKVKIDPSGLSPAVDKIAHLNVRGRSDDYDSSIDSSFDDIDMDAFMDVDNDDLDDAGAKVKWKAKESKPSKRINNIGIDSKPLRQVNSVPTKKEDNVPSWLSVYDSLTVTTEDSIGPLASSSVVTLGDTSVLEPDGSLRFFWLDYLELDGKIYFIGKLKEKTSGAWVSCCVTVEGMQRNLFVLPRDKRVEQDDEGQLYETDEIPDMKSVYEDFDRVRKKMGIKAWKGKFVKRRYAFGEADVPREESQWLKVVYGFDGNIHLFASFLSAN
jgi:DNA polymerase alpha subunit A